jgi:transposase
VLCEFRSRLIARAGGGLLRDKLLDRGKMLGLLKAGGRQRTDSTHVLAGVRATFRLECALEALRHALNSSTVVAPDWLRDHSSFDWIDRYGRRCDESRLPSAEADRRAFTCKLGEDGHALLAAAYGPGAPSWLAEVPPSRRCDGCGSSSSPSTPGR